MENNHNHHTIYIRKIDTIYIEYTNSFIQMHIYIQTKKIKIQKQASYTCNTRNVDIAWGNSSVYIQVIATGIRIKNNRQYSLCINFLSYMKNKPYGHLVLYT